jgi:uncharacterized protein YbjT (DUF2867 family)
MNRILVAGATGYLGGFVARELSTRGLRVRALARDRARLDPLAGLIDETAMGDVTRPDTLAGVCDGIDVVFSSVGITRQKDGLTFRDVDFQGNLNLLDAALDAGVKRFVYVSVFDGPALRHLEIVDAHEAFVDVLRTSGIGTSVIRPTGYYSDMGELLVMARRGRIWLIGSGESRSNPIHGADLAGVCANTIEGPDTEIDIGGPQILTWRETAELASAAVGRPAKISAVPERLMWAVVRLTRLVNRHRAELLAFFTTMATRDVVAPRAGRRTLGEHFQTLEARS